MAKIKALRDFAFDSIAAFLAKEKFPPNDELIKGVVYLANSICHYEEESVRLSPQVLISNDVASIAKTLPSYTLIPIMQNESLSLNTFKKALKACAPIARDNWIIYFDIGEEKIEFGLLASGVSEPNPSPYTHLKVGFTELPATAIYVKALSSEVLLIKGKEDELVVSFSLDEYTYNSSNDFEELSGFITRDIIDDFKTSTQSLFSGVLEQAGESSHGCLIAVLDKGDTLEALRTKVSNGIFLPTPIDISDCFMALQKANDPRAQMDLISLCAVVKRMIGHDGITLFSSDGKLLGYNLFIPSNDEETKEAIGGARTRAFKKLCAMEDFSCVFFRSQDGAMEVFIKGA